MKLMQKNYSERDCDLCGNRFKPNHPRLRRCDSCRCPICIDCGKPLTVRLWRLIANPERRCQECDDALDLPPGSKRPHSEGYVEIKCQDGKWKFEHRVVMEQVLGRSLSSSEIVHHVDENRANNSPSNLELCTGLRDHLDRFHKDILKSPPIHHNGRRRPGDEGYVPISVNHERRIAAEGSE